MPHKKRNVRKMRGSRTHGYGGVGQHRGGGQRGGRGKAGFRKHKWSYTIKYEQERMKKHGFKPPMRTTVRTINVSKLDEQVESLMENKKAEKTNEGIKIHLNRLGYDKLIGGGKVTHPLIIYANSYSKSAAEKIEGAGGKIIGPEQSNNETE